MENCEDPPDLQHHPIPLTRLVEPGVMPPLDTKYFSTCNLTAQFHIIASNTQVNNMTDRFLILSISLPENAYPSHLAHSRILDIPWPDTYQYEYDVSSRTHKIPLGTIWQAHRLKAIPTKSDPILLESIIIPTPIESLRFRTSFDNAIWSEPANFHPDDEGNMSLKQTANYQLDTSQQLINTDLDITLDNMIKGFIPRISTLGRETRPHAAHNKENTIRTFPNPATFPFVLDLPLLPRTRLSPEQAAIL